MKCYHSATFGNMSLEQGVEILREEMKDRSDKDESVLRGGQAHVTEQLRLSDEIQHHRDPDVTDMVSPQQAVIEKEKETVTPALLLVALMTSLSQALSPALSSRG